MWITQGIGHEIVAMVRETIHTILETSVSHFIDIPSILYTRDFGSGASSPYR